VINKTCQVSVDVALYVTLIDVVSIE